MLAPDALDRQRASSDLCAQRREGERAGGPEDGDRLRQGHEVFVPPIGRTGAAMNAGKRIAVHGALAFNGRTARRVGMPGGRRSLGRQRPAIARG